MLRARRVEAGFTQGELAKACKISKQSVCEIERGNQRPTRPLMLTVFNALDLADSDATRLKKFWCHDTGTRFDEIASAIRKLRLDAGLTQIDLALAIGSYRESISRAESGKKEAKELCGRIYDYFNVPQSERVYEDNQHPSPSVVGDAVAEGQ